MRLLFKTTGPCYPDEHYMIPSGRRLGDVLELIDDRKYFTLHAGRQTGKSTCVKWLEKHLNGLGQVRAIYVDIEAAREKPDRISAMRTIFNSFLDVPESVLPESKRPSQTMVDEWLQNPATALLRYLRYLSTHETLPLVLLFDNVDQLAGDAMASFLTQIRQGFIERHSIFARLAGIIKLPTRSTAR